MKKTAIALLCALVAAGCGKKDDAATHHADVPKADTPKDADNTARNARDKEGANPTSFDQKGMRSA